MFKQSIRSLTRSPRFSAPAVLMLAGGVAVSSVCYAVLETAVLKAIPYEAPTRLVQMGKTLRFETGRYRLSRADVELLRNRTHCFEALGYEKDVPGIMAGRAGAQVQVMEAQVSPGLIETFHLRPALGRSFRPEEFGPGASGAVLLSFSFWNTGFSADPSIIGKSVMIDGKDYTVIGIMPKALRRPVSVADVWLPDAAPAQGAGGAAASDLNVIARLREGLSLADAQREVAQLRPVRVSGWQRSSDTEAFVTASFADQLLGPASRILNLLLGACLLIQAVACFNVGQLLLARRMGKTRELGIRLALGSSAARLALSVLAETICIAAAAVFVAIPLVIMLLPVSAAVASKALGTEIHAALSPSVLAFSIVSGLISSLVCAAFPVFLLRRLEVSCLIGDRWQRDEFALSGARLQDILIVVQVAAAVVLLAGFGLLAKSVYRLSAVSAGFNPEHLSYVMFDRGTVGFPASALKMEEALARLSQLPSVKSAASGSTPLLTGARIRLAISVKTDEGGWMEVPPVPIQSVSAGYFRTMGIPLLKGREFDRRDVQGTPCAAIVNESFARLVWSSTDVLGRQLNGNSRDLRADTTCTIVGVVGDARDVALAQPPAPELFYSHLQKQTSGNITVLIRTKSSRSVPIETIRALIAEFNPTLRMTFHTDIGALVGTTLRPSETRAKLLGGLALLALLLAAGGMYAAATYGLGQRAKEFGIRLAMGAEPAALAWLIYRHYARLAAIAGLAGAAAASVLSQFVTTGLSLFDAKDFDFGVLAAAPVFCVIVVLASVAIPTLRAIGVDPSPLLRADAN